MSSIVSQTWDAIEATNAVIRSEKKTQKKGEVRLAEENSSVSRGTLGKLQQVEKDVIITADPNDSKAQYTAKTNDAESKPPLPQPKFNWNAFQGADGGQEGLIAIMGKVLALQAKMSSRFWSSLWKQASLSMEIQVKMAPIIGKAIETAYQNQAAATMCQANQAKEDGIASLMAFGGAVAMSGLNEFNDENTPFRAGGSDTTVEDETASGDIDDEEEEEGTVNGAGGNNNQDEINRDMEDVDNATTNKEEGWGSRLYKTYKKYGPGFGKAQRTLSNLLQKSQAAATMASMFSQGMTGLLVDSKYQAQKSGYEGAEGQCQALSKVAEQYAQYYGQDFSRTEDLRQGAGQNIDYAMNVLKGAADSITQSVTAMFRG